jgi:predicted PurR-regulated permease PerM
LVVKDPWIRALVIVMLLIAAVYLATLLWHLAVQFADIILLFFLAWVISFILEPLVAALHYRTRLPRNLSVLAAYLAMLVIVSLAIIQLVPPLTAQVIEFANSLPVYARWINDELLKWQAFLAQHGLFVSAESILSYQEIVRHVESLGPLLLSNTVGVATGVANLLFQVFIILILSYYMTLDGARISGALLTALPAAYRNDARYFFVSVNRAFAGFMRGQVAQAVIYGFGTAVVMTFMGMDLVLLSSVAAAAFMLLPFIGPFLAMVLPLAVAVLSRPEAFWVILVALFVLQQLVVNVIAPRLMSRSVGLHPLLVFLAVLGGAKVAGVWGAVFGVPVVAVLAAMASFYRATVEDRRARVQAAAPELPVETRPEAPEPVGLVGEAVASVPAPAEPRPEVTAAPIR